MDNTIKGLGDLVAASQNVSRSINTLNQTIKSIFPNGLDISTSAGSASGKYLVITASDGNQYKIQLLNPS